MRKVPLLILFGLSISFQTLRLAGLAAETGAGQPVELTIQQSIQVSFPAETGVVYQVLSSLEMPGPRTWQAVGPPILGAGGLVTFFYNATGDQKVFFRV